MGKNQKFHTGRASAMSEQSYGNSSPCASRKHFPTREMRSGHLIVPIFCLVSGKPGDNSQFHDEIVRPTVGRPI